MNIDRLRQQIEFLLEMDKLKSVLRRTYVLGTDRRENSAEHSWHLAVMAMVLAEHASAPVDILRVLKMLLVHDIVEIDAGDTYVYDVQTDKAANESAAADRIFGLLPDDQRDEMHGLWEEFEARETPEARFAAALDRLMPMLHNSHSQGRSWREHGITADQVLARNAHIADGSPNLWEYAALMIRDAVVQGYLAPGRDET